MEKAYKKWQNREKKQNQKLNQNIWWYDCNLQINFKKTRTTTLNPLINISWKYVINKKIKKEKISFANKKFLEV